MHYFNRQFPLDSFARLVGREILAKLRRSLPRRFGEPYVVGLQVRSRRGGYIEEGERRTAVASI